MKIALGKLAGHFSAAATITVWGTTFIASKILLTEFTPLQVMIIRFSIAYVTLLIINHKMQKTSLKEELTFLLLAVLGTTIYYLFENMALTITFASNVSILLSAAPILTVIVAHIFTKDEKINRNILLGSIIAFVGVALVIFNGTVILQLNPLGDILTFGAALSWAFYCLVLKKHLNKYNSVYLTRKVLFYSIFTTLPILIFEGKPFPFADLKNVTPIICLLFLGVFGSGICFVAWNIATKRLGIVTTSNYLYLGPFVTMVTAGLMLHEIITGMGVMGTLLIIAGVVVAGMKNKCLLLVTLRKIQKR
jgi:drug/metabolite transporter (DMT)-like permease